VSGPSAVEAYDGPPSSAPRLLVVGYPLTLTVPGTRCSLRTLPPGSRVGSVQTIVGFLSAVRSDTHLHVHAHCPTSCFPFGSDLFGLVWCSLPSSRLAVSGWLVHLPQSLSPGCPWHWLVPYWGFAVCQFPFDGAGATPLFRPSGSVLLGSFIRILVSLTFGSSGVWCARCDLGSILCSGVGYKDADSEFRWPY
jgi:hypothetical protein